VDGGGLGRRGLSSQGGMLDGEADEVLDEVDDSNQLTGRTVARKLAHAQARTPSPAPTANPEWRWEQPCSKRTADVAG
jgi:hypothetical protein